MKIDFRMNFGFIKTALIWVVVLGALAIIALDIALLSGAIHAASIVGASVSLAASALIIIFVGVLVFNSGYKFCDGYLRVSVGVFFDKVKYDSVMEVGNDILTGQTYILIEDASGKNGKQSLRLMLRRQQIEPFIAELKEHAPQVIDNYQK